MFAYNNIRSTQYIYLYRRQCMLQMIVTSTGLTINTQLLKNNHKLNSSRSLKWLLHFNMCPLTVDVCVHCLSALPAVQYPLRSIYTSNIFTWRQFSQVIRVCVEMSVNSNYQASGLKTFAADNFFDWLAYGFELFKCCVERVWIAFMGWVFHS